MMALLEVDRFSRGPMGHMIL